MTQRRWTLVGVLSVLALALAWVVWGESLPSAREQARRSLVGSWAVVHEGLASSENAISRIDVGLADGGGLTADVYRARNDTDVLAATWAVVPVPDDDAALDIGEMRVRLVGPDALEVTDRPDPSRPSATPWRATAARRGTP